MTASERFSTIAARGWNDRRLVLKAMSFAMVGVVNTLIDAGIFFIGYTLLAYAASNTPASLRLVIANVMSWSVAVSCSYVMNSFTTFAAESGRKLRRRDYATFVGSGVVGAIANTGVLVAAAQILPVWLAKGLAILASFVVNFSLSHFVVFRRKPAGPRRRDMFGAESPASAGRSDLL